MEKIKNIFFDFDGVLANSVLAKTEAFREIYLPYGNDISDKVVNHHIHNGGVSRYEKFKIYHKRFLNKEIDQKEVDKLASLFSSIVLEKVIESESVEGSVEFLKKYSNKIKCWVITGTPTSEIKLIVEKRNLSSFFIGLHGSPQNKRYWTEYLIEKHDLNRNETLFIGDATTDFDAAQFSKLRFALREHEENETIFENYKGIRFKNFNELENLLINDLI